MKAERKIIAGAFVPTASGFASASHTIRIIVESPDWKAYGDSQAKMQTDPEWQGFLAKAISDNLNPRADLIGTGSSTDVLLD